MREIVACLLSLALAIESVRSADGRNAFATPWLPSAPQAMKRSHRPRIKISHCPALRYGALMAKTGADERGILLAAMSETDRGISCKDVAALLASMSAEELAKVFALLSHTDRAALLAGMSYEEIAVFLANKGADERGKLLSAMRDTERAAIQLLQQPLDKLTSRSRLLESEEEVPATKLLEEEQDKLPVPGDASQLLTERVRSAVQTIKRRKLLLKQYAQDIQGKTGLGGLAALAYCRRVVNRREPIWGDLLMIVMANQPKAVEEIVMQTARETLSAPISNDQWVWFKDNLLSTYLWFSPSSVKKGSFIYHRLLDLAQEQLKMQAERADKMKFPSLSSVPSRAFLPGGKSEIRQDHRLVGNMPSIRQQLLGTRHTMEFYDLHVYLNDLLCIARIINPEFQSHISRIMAPMAHLALVEPGPLKSLARCRAKVGWRTRWAQ